jgi:hypothetical protein
VKKILSILCFIACFAPLLHAQTYTNTNEGFVIGYRSSGIAPATNQLGVQDPRFNPMIVYSAPETASQTAYFNFSVSTATIIANTTTYTLANADYTDIITPRNLVIIASCTPTSATYSGTALVTGKDQNGNAATATILVSTYTSTTYGIGYVAWSTITSIKFVSAATTATSLNFQVGSGVKLGLPAHIVAATNIVKVIENKALSTTYTLDLTYDTISFAAAPDGTKNYIVYAVPKIR